jgi:hypothetical protein
LPVSDLVYPTGGDYVSDAMNYPLFRSYGCTFAMRYAVRDIPGKMITRREIDTAHKAGVDIGLIYETTGTTWRGGYNAGLLEGAVSKAAMADLGAPGSVACYHTIDEEVPGKDLPLAMEWLRAIAEARKPYRTGVYGQFSVIEAANSLDPSIYRWQTEAWSGTEVSMHTDILQLGTANVGGINIDVDLAYCNAFGQWYANPAYQKIPGKDNAMPSGPIPPMSTVSLPLAGLSWTSVTLYCDTGLYENAPQHVRVAMYSAAKKYSQIVDYTLTTSEPHVLAFEERDVVALSFHRGATHGEGTVGYAVE